MTTLAWGGIQYKEAYKAAGELDNLKKALRKKLHYSQPIRNDFLESIFFNLIGRK